MSTASPIFFPIMEDPLGDSMDMTSPYPGHVDDFEIDIDLMEDQVSNVDIDFDVRDATPQPEVHTTNEGPAHDADMMDDVADPSVSDAFPNTETENQNENEKTYHSGETIYESEMLDEDFEDDIDAPILDSEVVVEPGEILEIPEDDSKPQTEEDPPQEDNRNLIFVGEPAATEENEVHVPTEQIAQNGTEHLPEGAQQDENAEEAKTDSRQENTDTADHVETKQEPSPDNTEAQTSKDFNGELDGPAVVHDAKEDHDQTSEARPEEKHPDQEQCSHYLHPVKVIYQDTEISLFPPREGDSSETFFLEDEGLVSKSFGDLLAACRQILGEHTDDQEALVVDIEPLGLQISEDDLHVSKVTLSQIVDIYLHLCQNDGTDEPEPLYLHLSTRLTLLAEMFNLGVAANEGKSISQINSWGEGVKQEEKEAGEGAGGAAAAAVDENFIQKERNEEVPDDIPVKPDSDPTVEVKHGKDSIARPEQNIEDNVSFTAQAVNEEPSKANGGSDGQENKPGFPNEADASQDVDESTELSHSQEHDDQTNEYDEQEEDFDATPDAFLEEAGHDDQESEHETLTTADLPSEGAYDDSEEQTDSTATLAHASVTYPGEQQHDQVVGLSTDYDDNTAGYNENEYEPDADEDVTARGDEDQVKEDSLEEQDFEEGEYVEEEEWQKEGQTVEDQDDDGNYNEDGHDDTSAVELQDDSIPPEDVHWQSADLDVPKTQQDGLLSSTDELTADQQLDSKLDRYDESKHDDQRGEAARQTPELTDDFLGLDDDLFASPDKGARRAGSSLAAPFENVSGNANEVEVKFDNSRLSHEPSDDFDDLGFDDEDFDLNATVKLENEVGEAGGDILQPRESGPGKRSREAEDEIDLVQISTPDAKRRRPS